MVRKILRSRLLRRLAKQTDGLRRVPEPLQGAIKTYLQDYPNHQLRQHVFNLSLMLSGRHEEEPSKGLVPVHTPSPNVLAAVEDYFDRKGPFAPVPKRYSNSRIRPKYDEKQVAAYVASRMPAVYTVIQNVLSEISRRLPDFKPVNALDYGSGPGTSIWALCQIWPNTVKQVNMVETSPAMLAASKKILEDLDDAPAMYNHKSLRVLSTKSRHSRHDIVIACYSIGELSTVAEQITAARQLWALTRDILVIIEPGTSEGSLTVRGIRAHILALERKKLRRRRKFLSGSSKEVPLLGTHQEHQVTSETNMLDIKEYSKDERKDCKPSGGAHVVAPCPHDGGCPMDGTEQFCHFVQRLERTLTQRIAKKHSTKMLRGYEDEKYCYVVLRRGHRPRMKWPLDHVQLQLDKEEEPVNELIVDYVSTDEEFAYSEEEHDEEEAGKDAEEVHSDDDNVVKYRPDDGDADSEEEGKYVNKKDTDKSEECMYTSEEQEVVNTAENEHGNYVSSEGEEGVLTAASVETTEDEHDECIYSEGEGGDKDDELEESTETAANMSGGWGRVIFKPYRRGKHVILDVCRSTERDASAGSFDRLIVTRAKHRVLHRAAKKARWGDLWPCLSSKRSFRDNRDNRIPLHRRRDV